MKVSWTVISLSIAVAIASCALSACNRGRNVEAAREDGAPLVSASEKQFMIKATQANLSEIEMARIAQQKSGNTDVRDYANMIRSDHNGAQLELTDLMKEKNIPLPKTLSSETDQAITRMNDLAGPEFDREFVNAMVADHQKAVEMFRDQAASVENADVRKHVEIVLPKLEMHLEKGQRLQSSLFSSPKK